MGLKETILTNWKGKIVEYQERKFYILEQFDYEGTEYLYGIDINTVDQEKPNVVFLSRVNDNIFQHVSSEELFNLLILRVAGVMTSEIYLEEYKKIKNTN